MEINGIDYCLENWQSAIDDWIGKRKKQNLNLPWTFGEHFEGQVKNWKTAKGQMEGKGLDFGWIVPNWDWQIDFDHWHRQPQIYVHP